jgi:hypothetical protein
VTVPLIIPGWEGSTAGCCAIAGTANDTKSMMARNSRFVIVDNISLNPMTVMTPLQRLDPRRLSCEANPPT